MKRYLRAVSVILLLVFGAAASGPAMAQRVGHGFGGHGYGWGGGPRFGISIGVPLFWPGYYPGYYPYPAYGYPGPAVAPSAGYVEQGYAQMTPAPAQPQGEWHFCASSNAYYPYVRECPGCWHRVPAQPPR